MGWNFFWRSIPITVFLVCILGWAPWNLSCLELKFDDIGLSYWQKSAETIQEWNLFKGGNYLQKYVTRIPRSISTHCVLTRPYHILKEHAKIDDLGGNMITAYHTYVYPVARYVICNLQPKIDKKHIFQFLQIVCFTYDLWWLIPWAINATLLGPRGFLCTPHTSRFASFLSCGFTTMAVQLRGN